MNILFVATVRSHIGQFWTPTIKALKSRGDTVYAAYRDNSADKQGLDLSMLDEVFEVPFSRSPFAFVHNIKAYRALKSVIDSHQYDVIHCNTPVGAMLTRIAARNARKCGTKVVYTAHGFHFYKGAPLLNWLFYYPVEKFLSRYTDVLMTINEMDYETARTHRFRTRKIVRIDGVGVDLSKFRVRPDREKPETRRALGLPEDAFIMLYAADLSKRKNQEMIFRALARIRESCPNILVLMPGQPILKEKYTKLCKELGIADMVQMPGYRRDIPELLTACDCVISSSRQEGLPVNLIEAAASGKYIIATDARGNADVVKQWGYGALVEVGDDVGMAEKIQEAYRRGTPVREDVSAIEIYNEKSIVRKVLKLYEVSGDL